MVGVCSGNHRGVRHLSCHLGREDCLRGTTNDGNNDVSIVYSGCYQCCSQPFGQSEGSGYIIQDAAESSHRGEVNAPD